GWFLLIPCVAVGADMFAPYSSAVALSGSGGAAGAWLHGWLESTFDSSGCFAILVGCSCLGLFLGADFILVPLVHLLWNLVHWLFVPGPDEETPRGSPAAPEPMLPSLPRTASSPVGPTKNLVSQRHTGATEVPIRHHDQAGVALGHLGEAPAAEATIGT